MAGATGTAEGPFLQDSDAEQQPMLREIKGSSGMDTASAAIYLVLIGLLMNLGEISIKYAMTHGGTGYWIAFVVTTVPIFPILWKMCRAVGIVFGCPQVPIKFAIWPILPWICFPLILSTNLNEIAVLLCVLLSPAAAFLRGFAILPFALCATSVVAPQALAAMNPGQPAWIIYANGYGAAISAVMSWAAVFTVYLHHQRICFFIIFYFNSVSSIFVAPDPATASASAFFSVVYGYLFLLFARRERVLPRALQGCKFISLAYIRHMWRNGMTIQRCQEMPTDAFGDVRKASRVIILSHRWLNRFTCDVKDSTGRGCRLKSLITRLSAEFPETYTEAFQRGICAGLLSIWRALVNEPSDVLLFIDFVCLPQIGLDSNGEQIPRTVEETELFMQALPCMGALYGMYPVLVTPEVTPEVHPYFASGWCSSEFYTAMLAKQLDEFSKPAVSDFSKYCSTNGLPLTETTMASINDGTLSIGSVATFNDLFSQDLAQKKFFDENDRSIVKGIVEGYLLRRLLADAITNQNAADVALQLCDMRERGLTAILNQAVNDSGETLLHIAARLYDVEIVSALLNAGADPHARNLRGDTPTQCFMWPRMNASARMCR